MHSIHAAFTLVIILSTALIMLSLACLLLFIDTTGYTESDDVSPDTAIRGWIFTRATEE